MNKTIPNIIYIVNHDICIGCGLCEGTCPTKAISIETKNGCFVPTLELSKCNNKKGCHKCFDICPGQGINLAAMAKDLYSNKEMSENNMSGRYLNCYTGFSNNDDIRWHSASGGIVSHFLIWLLEKHYIDGAIVTKFDNSQPLMVKTFIATTKDDILDARSSKYGPVSMHGISNAIKNAQGSRYVVVGLPCHIQGFRKLMSVDKRLCDKVIGLFAIYCSSGRSFYLTEYVMKERGIKREELHYFAYRDEGCLGSMVAISGKEYNSSDASTRLSIKNSEQYISNGGKRVFKERFQGYYHPLRSFFVPKRCQFCIDHYGELGDICFGDIHIKPYSEDKVGVNSLIVRNQYWLSLLEQCKQEEAITLEVVPFETISKSQVMSFKKKGRNGAFINLGKKLGWVVPIYDVDYLRQPTIWDAISYLQYAGQRYLGRHKCMWWLISLLKRDTSKLQ